MFWKSKKNNSDSPPAPGPAGEFSGNFSGQPAPIPNAPPPGVGHPMRQLAGGASPSAPAPSPLAPSSDYAGPPIRLKPAGAPTDTTVGGPTAAPPPRPAAPSASAPPPIHVAQPPRPAANAAMANPQAARAAIQPSPSPAAPGGRPAVVAAPAQRAAAPRTANIQPIALGGREDDEFSQTQASAPTGPRAAGSTQSAQPAAAANPSMQGQSPAAVPPPTQGAGAAAQANPQNDPRFAEIRRTPPPSLMGRPAQPPAQARVPDEHAQPATAPNARPAPPQQPIPPAAGPALDNGGGPIELTMDQALPPQGAAPGPETLNLNTPAPPPDAPAAAPGAAWRLPAGLSRRDDPLLDSLVVLTAIFERPHSAECPDGRPAVGQRPADAGVVPACSRPR